MKRLNTTIIIILVVTAIVAIVNMALYPYLLEWTKDCPYWYTFFHDFTPTNVGNVEFGFIMTAVGILIANKFRRKEEEPELHPKIHKVSVEEKKKKPSFRTVKIVVTIVDMTVQYVDEKGKYLAVKDGQPFSIIVNTNDKRRFFKKIFSFHVTHKGRVYEIKFKTYVDNKKGTATKPKHISTKPID